MLSATQLESGFSHTNLSSGVEFAVDHLPERKTVAMCFRMLGGVLVDPPELTGIGAIAERTLAKGTKNYSGRAFADALDHLGAQWGTAAGRQSILIRSVCLPEHVLDVVDLMAELICRPTFPDDACEVAVQLALEELRHMEDDAQELLQLDMHRLVFGPDLGRDAGGDAETLARITPEKVRAHWRDTFHAGRVQVVAAGAVDGDALAARIDERFAGFGSATQDERAPVEFTFTPDRHHRNKDLKQQYIAITLPGLSRDDADFAVEQVLLGVLSGGMGGRLFTEVREKQGLVYWVGAWHEQPRGRGIINLGASTTPQRCEKTYKTLLRELERLSEDLTEQETTRARDGLLAQAQTEDDLTRARAAGLSTDLFHFSRPIGPMAKLEAIRAVTVERVEAYVRRMPRDQVCVTTVGPAEPAQAKT
jgi:predicted Zn-dependent peptidase